MITIYFLVKYFKGALNKLCNKSVLKIAGVWRLPSINIITETLTRILEEDGWRCSLSFSYRKIRHPKANGKNMTFAEALDLNYYVLCTLVRSNRDCHAVVLVSHDEDFYFCKNTRSVRSKNGDDTIKISKNKNPFCQEFTELNQDWSFFHEGFILDFRVSKWTPYQIEVTAN